MAEDLEETLRWFLERHKDDKPILFDFDRPIDRPCQWCGYPFDASTPRHIKSTDCPIHEPPEWKYARRHAEELAVDQMIVAEIEFSKESTGL